jgi:hypothetical protein
MKNDWEKKEKTCSTYLSNKIFATSARVWTRSTSLSSFQWSNDPLSISSFSLNPSRSAFFHALTLSLLPKNHMLFIVSKQCACSRRVHIESHMNRFEFLSFRTIILITIVLGLFVKKSYLLQHNSVLIFILWRSVRKTTIFLGMKKIRF